VTYKKLLDIINKIIKDNDLVMDWNIPKNKNPETDQHFCEKIQQTKRINKKDES
jgi:hypothetical protein